MENFIKNYLKKLNIEINENQVKSFVIYKNLLVELNKVMNLTGITEDKDVVIKHFADSITPLNIVDFKNKSVIDIGTGAGFPGLPLKIAEPTIKLTLLDSLTKRLNFLKKVCHHINVEAEFVHGRAEELGQDVNFREQFDIAVSRAVAPLNILAEFDLPYVKVGGLMIALKGPAAYDEIESAQNAVNELGGKFEKVEQISLPETDLNHTIVVIRKTEKTPEKYPRRVKKIERSPL